MDDLDPDALKEAIKFAKDMRLSYGFLGGLAMALALYCAWKGYRFHADLQKLDRLK